MAPDRSRRAFLRASGAAVVGSTFAGCLADVAPSYGRPTVEVGPGLRLVFSPETVRVEPGTTVRWIWRGDDHNIVVNDRPANASWDGTPGGPAVTYGERYVYETTFDVSGRYVYFCEPHVGDGMTGRVVVE